MRKAERIMLGGSPQSPPRTMRYEQELLPLMSAKFPEQEVSIAQRSRRIEGSSHGVADFDVVSAGFIGRRAH
jgi:hypothetical protein